MTKSIIYAMIVFFISSCQLNKTNISCMVMTHDISYSRRGELFYHSILKCEDGKCFDTDNEFVYATAIGDTFKYTQLECPTFSK